MVTATPRDQQHPSSVAARRAFVPHPIPTAPPPGDDRGWNARQWQEVAIELRDLRDTVAALEARVTALDGGP